MLNELQDRISGEVCSDLSSRIRYATDASVYREMPLGVVFPKDVKDIVEIVRFAKANGISIIPRAAGTSLAGQVVGCGLVMDITRHLNHILEINPQEKYAIVEPLLHWRDVRKQLLRCQLAGLRQHPTARSVFGCRIKRRQRMFFPLFEQGGIPAKMPAVRFGRQNLPRDFRFVKSR